MIRESEKSDWPGMDPRVEERLAIIEQSDKELEPEVAAGLRQRAKQEIKALTGWDENEVEEEIARYLEGKRDPSPQG